MKIIFACVGNTSYLNEEFNCTEPSPLVGDSWCKLFVHNLIIVIPLFIGIYGKKRRESDVKRALDGSTYPSSKLVPPSLSKKFKFLRNAAT